MAKINLKFGLLGFLSLFLISCDFGDPYLPVIRGNFFFAQGEFQSAIVQYLDAMKDSEYKEWVAYNLGNVYQALGEEEAAIEMWEVAEEGEYPELLYRVSFNQGTLYYEMGNYHDAYDKFKHALEIKSSSVEAKINLELSLLKIRGGAVSASPPAESNDEDREDDGNVSERVLDYVKRKEEQRWTATDFIQRESFQKDW